MSVNMSVKQRNMLDVIRTIKFHGPMTKAEIGRNTGLTNVTVNSFINELSKNQIVYENGVDFSTGGRNAAIFSYNESRYYCLGLFIGISSIKLGLFDFNLVPVYMKSQDVALGEMTIEHGLSIIEEFVNAGVSEASVDPDRLAGLGVSAPGPVNYEKGIIINLVNIPSWKNVPIKQALEKRLGIPTTVDKDTFCNISCLSWLKPNQNKSVVYLATLDGVGAGVMINGYIHRGQHYVAGEFGHMSMGCNDIVCNCGKANCTESTVSDTSIVRKAMDALGDGFQSSLNILVKSKGQLSVSDIVDGAISGDELSREVFTSLTDDFVEMFDRVIKAYDPDKIVFDSSWMRDYPDFFNSIVDKLFGQSMLIRRDNIEIELNEVDDLFLKGAAALVIAEQFSLSNPHSLLLRL